MLTPWLSPRAPRNPQARRPRRPLLYLEALEERYTPTVTFAVNTLDDTHALRLGDGTAKDANGNVSLRSAVEESNVTLEDTVIQMPGLTGTITLESALPALANNIYINGSGSNNLTVTRDSAAGNFRIFEVLPGWGCVIGGLTLRNGAAFGAGPDGNGGAILNFGVLTVSGCTITANGAVNGGGIANERAGGSSDRTVVPPARLTVLATEVSNNLATGYGGGVFNADYAAISSNVTVAGNAARTGGGLVNEYRMSVDNSVIQSNTATNGDGGGIWSSGPGDYLSLSSTTVASNRCYAADSKGGGLYVNNPSDITDCVFQDDQAGRGSGIWWTTTWPPNLSGTQLLNCTAESGDA
jgi:hypothetical protein